MKALRFIFLLSLAATTLAMDKAPHFAFQKVTFSIMTRDSILDLTYWWDIERGILGAPFRHHYYQHFEREGRSFVRRLQDTHVEIRYFDGEHPRTARIQVTGRITFTPPNVANRPGLPDGTLPPGTYAAIPDITARLSRGNEQMDIAYVLVTILAPGQRDLGGAVPAALDRDIQNMNDIIGTFPILPAPNQGPIATGIFTPDVELQYRLDGNMIQHALDDTLWKMQDKDILCTATDLHGKAWDEGRTDSTQDLFALPWNYIAWKLWGDVRVFGLPNTTNDIRLGPIWDCSDEASTSGTKDEESTSSPKDELKRRRLLGIGAPRNLGGLSQHGTQFDSIFEGVPI